MPLFAIDDARINFLHLSCNCTLQSLQSCLKVVRDSSGKLDSQTGRSREINEVRV